MNADINPYRESNENLSFEKIQFKSKLKQRKISKEVINKSRVNLKQNIDCIGQSDNNQQANKLDYQNYPSTSIGASGKADTNSKANDVYEGSLFYGVKQRKSPKDIFDHNL